MYFDQIPRFNFKNNFDTSRPFYAHLKARETYEKKESLEAHMGLTLDYFNKLCAEKNLDSVFENFETLLVGELSDSARFLWRELFYNAIYTHDLGKTNPNFQYQKMANQTHRKTSSNNSNHSFFSALIYCNHYLNKIMDFKGKDQKALFFSLIFNGFIISKHHGYLGGFEDFLIKISAELFCRKNEHCPYYKESFAQHPGNKKDIQEHFEKILNALKTAELWKSISWVIYGRFLFSLLVSSDFYATSDFMHKPIADFGTIKNIQKYREAFNRSTIFKNIQKHKLSKSGKGKSPFRENEINRLRSDLFLEAEEKLVEHSKESIFFLEAPTGSGKTNTSINLALNLLESDPKLNKITYVFPFNTLVEQTKIGLEEAFNRDVSIMDEITIVNGITAIKEVKATNNISDGEWDLTSEKDRIDYEQSLLGRQFLHYPMILTTHVNFFDILFGTSRESVFPLAHLANSVIILDEIQSYRNDLWKEIILFLEDYTKLLNIRIIIMSATLPDLSILSLDKRPIPKLIKNPSKYYQHPLFKNRVSLDFSLLCHEKDIIIDKLLEKVVEVTLSLENDEKFSDMKNKIVVEFIYKSTALKFFDQIKQSLDNHGINRNILCITGDDNKAERKRIIAQAKSGKNLILVATQVIEAGVDIDMDMGFKDISLFDAEEQFLGRINRSCRKMGSKVYFFNCDNAEIIYRNDFRKQAKLTIIDPQMQDLLESKDFSTFYDIILKEINASKEANNDANIEKFVREILWRFDYVELQKHMELIKNDRQEMSVFIYESLEDCDGKTIDGDILWHEYKDLLTNDTLYYAEKRVKLSKLTAEMDFFIYQLPKFPFDYEDRIGELLFCKREDAFFPNGKFDRKEFKLFKETNLFL